MNGALRFGGLRALVMAQRARCVPASFASARFQQQQRVHKIPNQPMCLLW